jgi:D-alanyl-D-alanine carboxypeptidase (penicillin-binding protein 5/6)
MIEYKNDLNKGVYNVGKLFQRKKWYITVVLSFMLAFSYIFSLVNPNFARAAGPVDLKLNVKSAILIEADTGQVLYEYNADEALPPASMSKMMTEYLVLENIKNGKLSWDTPVTASKYAGSVIGSGQLIAEGETLSVKDMFYSLSIYSANDAAVALAEKIGGTEENFANMMNQKAKELGLSDSAHFINATGLTRADIGQYAPKNIQGETMLSARDTAKLADRLLKDHPEILDFTKIPSKKLRESDKSPMINWNWMLEGNMNNPNFKNIAYPGLDGLKTGHTNEAGYCFTGTAVQNGMRLISVVMGTNSERARFDETRKLLDYGFQNFEKKTVLNAQSSVDAMKTVKVKKGVKLEVPVVTEKEVTFILKKGAKTEALEITGQPKDESTLTAPIKQGDILGTVTVSYKDPDTNQVQKQQVNMVAAEPNDKAGWFRLSMRAVKNLFVDLFTGIKNMF